MRTTMKNLMTWGLTLAVVGGFAATAIAGGPPYDAGYKARGMKEREAPRMMRTYAAPQANYRSFSYVPQANVAQTPCGNVTAPMAQAQTAPQAVAGVRRFSYEPAIAAPAPVTRNWNYGTVRRCHTGYGGDYGSKALLYK